MKRLLVLTTAVLVLGLAPPAVAGTYDVVACGTGTGNGSWVPHVSNGYVTAYTTCPGEGIVTRMSGGSEKAPNLASAYQEFTAPPGTRIVRLTANMLFNSQNGWNLGFIDDSRPVGLVRRQLHELRELLVHEHPGSTRPGSAHRSRASTATAAHGPTRTASSR